MAGTSPQQNFYAHDYPQDHGAQAAQYTGSGGMTHPHMSEMQGLHLSVMQLEARCKLLENIVQDAEGRLERQEEARIKKDYEMKKNFEECDQRIKGYEDKMGEMALHIRTRDRQIMAVEEKYRRMQKQLQEYHKKKHEIATQAKKEEREAIKDERRATQDLRCRSGEPRGEAVRRTPSSGSLFGRNPAGGSSSRGSGGERGGAGRAGPNMQPDQIRKKCFENRLKEFFML